MINPLILIIISFGIGLFCIKYIRSLDKYEKEPFWHMFAVTCWGGGCSVVISLIIYTILHNFGIRELHNTFGALIVIGPVEELSKFLGFLACYFIIKKQLNEPVDGIIYMACVALGFSLIENFFYATGGINNGHLIFVRLLISTPMHISFSIFMGLTYYIYLQNKKAFLLILYAFTYASLAHGVYDLVLFNQYVLIVLMLVVQVSYSMSFSFLSYATAQSPFRKTLFQFITENENSVLEDGIECLNCGSKNQKLTYRWDDLKIQKCDVCDNYVTTKKGIFHIFHNFAATYKKLDSHYLTAYFSGKDYSTLYSNNFVSDKKKLAFFDLEKLNETIEGINQKIIENMDSKVWFPTKIFEFEKLDMNIDYEEVAKRGGTAIWKWVIYPYSMDKSKGLYNAPANGPSWNWKAFLIPELWFLYHEIHGIFFLMSLLLAFFVFLAFQGILILFSKWMLLIIFCGHLLAGRTGNQIFYARHGKWPE